jgi:hypothetical protein
MRSSVLFTTFLIAASASRAGQSLPSPIQNAEGLRLLVAPENSAPTLAVILPGKSNDDRSLEVLFPEHVTVRKMGDSDGEHLYLFQPGTIGNRPSWRKIGQSLQYERDLPEGIHLLARATLQQDGVLFHYEFANHSRNAFDMVYAPTDPRLTSILHDVRLERTYVHHKDGFDLLASETPARLTMPMYDWLPARYLDSFTWPVPANKVERRSDGITYYNNSHPVDEPMIATVSSDGKWVVASFSRTTGNVWSNPELTCQHVDPQASLPPSGQAVFEVKMLIFRGSLDQALEKERAQHNALK